MNTELCDRLLFEFIETDELPMLTTAGVYSPVANLTYGGMPVLRQERGDLLLSYNITRMVTLLHNN